MKLATERLCGLMDSAFPDRLTIAIGRESLNSFAKRSGVGESLLRSYLKGTTPRTDKLIAIAKAANVSIEWLATGQGDMYYEQQKLPTSTREGGGAYSPIQREQLFEDILTAMKSFVQSFQAANPEIDASHMAVSHMRDDAMEPTLTKDAFYILDTQEKDPATIEDGIYSFHLDSNEKTRRLQRLPGNRLRVACDNPRYPSFDIDLNSPPRDFAIIGRVIWASHNL